MCSYEQEEEIEEHHDVGETNSICVLDADVILLGSALPSRDHWLSLNIKKGREKAIVSYYSSFVVLFPLSMRSLWPHSLRLLPNKKQKAEEKFSAFLAYAIKSRTEKKTIGQQLPKIQSCRDWADSLLSLTLHSVWKRQIISECFFTLFNIACPCSKRYVQFTKYQKNRETCWLQIWDKLVGKGTPCSL